jgi:hypothetical protein
MSERKKLLAQVTAILYSKDGGRNDLSTYVEQADYLIEAVSKYMRKRPKKNEVPVELFAHLISEEHEGALVQGAQN